MSKILPPSGAFKYLLAADCETSGLFNNSATPDYDHLTGDYFQAVSWGCIVVEAKTFKPLEELYVEIQHDGTALWDKGAERVHGLNRSYLKEHGVSEEDAAVQIAELIMKYWGPEGHVSMLGHNIASFDVHFMRSMFNRQQLGVRFSQRHVDSAGLMLSTFGTFTSDAAFEAIGEDARDEHNALEDARMSLKCVQTVNGLWRGLVEPNL